MKHTVTVGDVPTYQVHHHMGRVNLQDFGDGMVTNMSIEEARCLAAALHDPLVNGIAMSLYQYNVNSFERADKLYRHFGGACEEVRLMQLLVDHKNWATEMAYPTAAAYLAHAIERYGSEALDRVEANRD